MVPLTLVVLLAPAACSSDPTGTEEDDLLQALFGTWSWIQATGGISGTTRTPDSEGYKVELNICLRRRKSFISSDKVGSFGGEVDV